MIETKTHGGARPGAGRPKKDYKESTISLTPKYWLLMDRQAKKFGISRSHLLRQIIKEYLQSLGLIA